MRLIKRQLKQNIIEVSDHAHLAGVKVVKSVIPDNGWSNMYVSTVADVTCIQSSDLVCCDSGPEFLGVNKNNPANDVLVYSRH